MNKVLSLIIPTYNMEAFLEKCLNSLIVDNQTLLKSLEVIVVNDGSKDNSSQIAHKYEQLYPETFIVIDKENGNYGSCINRGLSIASGKYIKVLDSDDHFDNTVFSDYLEYLSHCDCDLVLNDFSIIDEKDIVTREVKYSFKDYNQIKFSDLPYKSLAMHGICYKLKVFSKLNYKQTEGISYTDQEWIFAPMTRVNTICYYPGKPLYLYLVGREGQTMSLSSLEKTIGHQLKGLESQLSFYCECDKISKDKKDYLTARLKHRLYVIYKTYLIDSDKLEIVDILNFDLRLKSENVFIYRKTFGINYKCIHFVAIWRILNRKPLPNLLKFFLKPGFVRKLLIFNK